MQPKDRRLVTEQNMEQYTAGVRGLSDQAMSTAQAANTKSDNAITRVEQLETVGGLAPGEVTDAQTANLITQPDSDTHGAMRTNVQRTAYPVDAGVVVDLWEPPTQPAGPDLTAWDAEDIYAMWDAIMADDPTYVTRSSIGDGTDGLPIYAYTFTPPAYGNTILLTGMHGAEKIGMYTVAQMMQLMVADWQHHPALAALRARTRIVVVPIASRHSVDNNNRKNANGVDLNRNWDYEWSEFSSSPSDPTYKGTAPFSEPETQAIRDLTYQLKGQGGLVAALDIHDTGATQKPDGYHFYAGPPANQLAGGGSWLRQLIDEIVDTQGIANPNIQLAHSRTPAAKNWFADQGLWSATIEYEMRWGTESMDATNMTASLRWIGNAIIRAATLGAITAIPPQPFIKKFSFNAGSSRIPIPVGSSSNMHRIEELSFEFVPPSAGFIEFSGYLSVSGEDPDQVTIVPTAGQMGTQTAPDAPSTSYDSIYASHNGNYGSGLVIIPFTVSAPVVPNPRSPVRIGIFAYASTVEAVIYRYRGQLRFTPAEDPLRFEQWSATGRGGEGEGALHLVRGV